VGAEGEAGKEGAILALMPRPRNNYRPTLLTSPPVRPRGRHLARRARCWWKVVASAGVPLGSGREWNRRRGPTDGEWWKRMRRGVGVVAPSTTRSPLTSVRASVYGVVTAREKNGDGLIPTPEGMGMAPIGGAGEGGATVGPPP